MWCKGNPILNRFTESHLNCSLKAGCVPLARTARRPRTICIGPCKVNILWIDIPLGRRGRASKVQGNLRKPESIGFLGPGPMGIDMLEGLTWGHAGTFFRNHGLHPPSARVGDSTRPPLNPNSGWSGGHTQVVRVLITALAALALCPFCRLHSSIPRGDALRSRTP